MVQRIDWVVRCDFVAGGEGRPDRSFWYLLGMVMLTAEFCFGCRMVDAMDTFIVLFAGRSRSRPSERIVVYSTVITLAA
jgi:hypothetical protein